MLTSLVYLQQGNVEKKKKTVNARLEKLVIFKTTWGISMKFLGKMCLIIILKVAKNQG